MRPIWKKDITWALLSGLSHMNRLCSTLMLFLDLFLLARSPSSRTEGQSWSGWAAGCPDNPANNPLRGPSAEGTHFMLNTPGDLTSGL